MFPSRERPRYSPGAVRYVRDFSPDRRIFRAISPLGRQPRKLPDVFRSKKAMTLFIRCTPTRETESLHRDHVLARAGVQLCTETPKELVEVESCDVPTGFSPVPGSPQCRCP